MSLVHCRECGKENADTAPTCANCGAPRTPAKDEQQRTIRHRRQPRALLLALYLGALGVDRFYLGHPILGITKLLLLSIGIILAQLSPIAVLPFLILYIWVLTDAVLIATGNVKRVVFDT